MKETSRKAVQMIFIKTEQTGVNWIELAEVCCEYDMNLLAEWLAGSFVTSPVT
jgi:hypothetical protein